MSREAAACFSGPAVAFCLAVALSAQEARPPADGLQAVDGADGLAIQLAGRVIADYHFSHPQTHRPFYANLRTPGGIPVTRTFPPVAGVDPLDHAFMHPGVSLGFANISGVNFWHNNDGRVVHRRLVTRPAVAAGVLSFTVENQYVDAGGRSVCTEITHHVWSRTADGYLVGIDSRFSSDRDFYFGVKEEMGLALRVATSLAVKQGRGTIRSAAGGRNESGTWGIVDRWWDYAGPAGADWVGVQLMSAPGNPPVWAHARDYGLIVANPFPLDNQANQATRTLVQAGAEFRLRFGVRVHETPLAGNYDPVAAYEAFRQLVEKND